MMMLSRRALAKRLAGGLFLAIAMPVGVRWRKLPVVSFFFDQPYLDMSGTGDPYRPPQGLRGGEAVAQLSEREFRHIAPHG